MDIGRDRGPDTSQLFLVRLWADGAGASEEDGIRGKVTHILSGEASSFGDLPTLMNLLAGKMLPANNSTDEVIDEKGTGL